MVDLGEEIGVSWLEIILLIAVLAGLFAGAVLVAQRPSFWLGLGVAIFKAGWPQFLKIITKRMPPEQEKAWRDCIRRGGEWDHLKKRCKR